MLQKDFETLLKGMIEEEYETMNKKGEEYTQNSNDRLKNFKSVALELGISPMVAWYVYFKKHIDSIANYVKCGEVKSTESIESRIMDARNYLALGRALIEDIRKGKGDVIETKVEQQST